MFVKKYPAVFLDFTSIFYGFPLPSEPMTPELTSEEIYEIQHKLSELMLEHRDLDEIVDRLIAAGDIEELKIKRLKKRKLQIKDEIARLEDKLIPDILA